MRITNSIITANSKANININKAYSDKMNTMTASGQKIQRPSEDPVVAIRAMRLNTSLSELEQYKGKNIPDADAWFTDTETALDQTNLVLSDIIEKLNQASSQENVVSNVKDIAEELTQLKYQFYSIGNADSAGRTVFTGYRTGEMLTFLDKDTICYDIFEHFGLDDLETVKCITGREDVSTAIGASNSYVETGIQEKDVHRIRLSYDALDGTTPAIKVDGADQTVAVKSVNGLTQEEKDDLYAGIGDDEIYFIPETGEVILGKNKFAEFKNAKDIEVEYQKSEWKKGDLRPEHYFQCMTPKNPDDNRTFSNTYPDGIEYNYNRVNANGDPVTKEGTITGFKEQEITYEIAYNQSININTHASRAYSHDIGRDIDELINITQELATAETKLSDINKMLESETDAANIEKLEKMKIAANKEIDLVKEKMHDTYTSSISYFTEYSQDVNKQIAEVGALTARLEMTKNRVIDQQTNVKKLADENINADISETAIDYKSALNALEAARLAAGKVSEQTLLNYI